MSVSSESVPPIAAAPAARIAEVDILRGFALFGILLVNVFVATQLWDFGNARDFVEHDGGQWVLAVLDALFSGRFYLLFAFLFGYSFALQIEAAQQAGVSERARLLRRCAALLVIGFAHVSLLWLGDILTLYAVLGLILIACRNLRPRTARITGILLYVASILLPGLDTAFYETWVFLDFPDLHVDFTRSFTDTLHAQATVGPKFVLLNWLVQGLPSLGLLLIGMAAGKRGVLHHPDTLYQWAPRTLRIGLVVGLPISAVTFADTMRWIDASESWPELQALINPLMTFAYIAAIMQLAAYAPHLRRYLEWLAPAGRMAATNYIAQSVVLMALYSGYGLGLADQAPPTTMAALALLTFAAQLALSSWWLRRYQYGPVEWALRAATYLSIPPWRKPL
ncbi:DUF418 domain-containing protein [Nocardia sp. XZ_19_385]|uniref:DUF418 domain-containing protein n=1 Tax=Nocardia sp. XZ_19_385 TaxID=2769488 RepID=UPI00188F351B|nr:DUF418 domain-containing protein [Nocardia sp. XZ_19_385]